MRAPVHWWRPRVRYGCRSAREEQLSAAIVICDVTVGWGETVTSQLR